MRRRRAQPIITGGSVSYRAIADQEAKVEDAIVHAFHCDPRNVWRYQPPPEAMVPKGGAWCIIRSALPPMEREIDSHVTVGRVFWCEHVSDNCDDEGFEPDGSYAVLARTPFGEPRLLPHEYRTISVPLIMEITQQNGFTFHPSKSSAHEVNDTLFYCMSRGIPRGDAMVMALGTLSGPVGWFDPHPGLLPVLQSFMSVGAPLTEVNHARRRAAQAARRKGARGG
jgi:hypothetical protein